LFGFLVGLLVSTLGGGGGGLYVPILTLVFGIPPQVAVATSLASVLPTTAAGAFSHHREGNVDIRTGIILGIGGIIGTIIGAYIANMIPPIILKKSLGVFTLLMLIPLIRSLLKRRENKNKDEDKKTITLKGYRRVLASFFGVASGLMAGVFGLSGTPPVSMGLYSLGLPAVMVVGTTVFVLIFNSITGIGSYFLLGRLDIPLIILLGSGAVVGAFLGPKLLKKMNPKTFEKIYGPLIISISLILGLGLILS
ncbi:MAG TPA: sulfite exporter TauE/SafE family protein, partial [Methanobacterium sp.]|nr:sulfite exporter TauE/SafE family protein [Methanobacterium sp.]